MAGFDEQIRQRNKYDDIHLKKSYQNLASVVDRTYAGVDSMRLDSNNNTSLYEVCRYYGLEDLDLPSDMTDINEKMDYLLESRGVMRRRVTLKGKWWTNMSGPCLCQKKDGGTVALFQNMWGHYYWHEQEGNRNIRITRDTAALLEDEAVCFYRPLPQRRLNAWDIAGYIKSCFETKDIMTIIVISLLITVIGLITPAVNIMIFSDIVPAGADLRLLSLACLLVSVALCVSALNVIRDVYRERITERIENSLSAAAFARVLTLPADFFKEHGSGDLANRVMAVEQLGEVICDTILNSGITALFSIIYIFQIFNLSDDMLGAALTALILQLLVAVATVVLKIRLQNRSLIAGAKLDGTVYALIAGIQKIKLAGAESRAFHRWSNVYAGKAETSFNPPLVLKLTEAFTPVAVILGNIIIYRSATIYLDIPKFMAFQAAYGLVSGAIIALTQAATELSMISPILKLIEPILQAVPETGYKKENVASLSGEIEVNGLSFRYTEDGPWIIDGLDLKIEKGQYVAIVGTTGCGKSTLLRLFLGFEKPDKGSVFYDGKDIQRVDIRSLRRNIGVVLQEGRLFSGDIFSNIALCAPGLTLDEAWEAAEIAEIADDISRMPMEMNTMLSEGSGGISGGQRQRILIARAVAAKPSILIFDEATSALDNVTQAKVSSSLDGMNCTRIVVAHRLSTIRHCDRIIVMDKGHIVEDGTYEELCDQKGVFAELVERQRLDV